MNDENEIHNKTKSQESKAMNEWLFLAGIAAAWFVLQAWILPGMGIST